MLRSIMMANHDNAPRIAARPTCSCGVSLLAIGTMLALMGCTTGSQHADTPDGAATKPEPVSLTCPSLSSKGSADLAALFGIDAALAAKLERTLRLAAELEQTSEAFLAKTNATCTAIATDIDTAPIATNESPCVVAATRLSALRTKLQASGAKLSIGIDNAHCTIPGKEIAACGGECLTGVAVVVTKIECSSGGANECSGDIQLPNASNSCITQCRTRALRLVKCDADISIAAEGAAVDPALSATLAKLKKDIPALIGLGTDGVTRAAKIAGEVGPLVDDVAGAIDAMTSSGSAKERRVAVGAVLATCLAPPLARTVQASKKLAGSLDGAKTLHASLVAR